MKKIIGITGGIACGKSYVSNIIKQYYPVIDCDVISHDLLDTNMVAIKEVVEAFGTDILVDGKIVRKKLGQKVFANEENRLKLNQILHPIIIEQTLKEAYNVESNIVFIDAPLLFETNLDKKCDLVICVYVDEQTQINRLINRDNLSLDEAMRRIRSQMPLKDKVSKSNFIIDNSGNMEECKNKVLKILEEEFLCH